jgi:3D (Asp-Asp-Asp) domain-containing protein
LDDEGEESTHFTTASTVGEALRQIGMVLYLADNVVPGLGMPLVDEARITVDRSTPVQVVVDGRTMRSRTHREHVGQVLSDLGIVLTGQDYTSPTLDSPLTADTIVRVVRVSERFEVEQEPIPFESIWQADPELEIDNTRLLQEGSPGILQRRIRIMYEDDQEVGRSVENEYVAVAPTTKINGYGTQIIVRTLSTPEGTIEYWRTIRMLATSYSAGTSGTSPDSSWYGRTATGMKMRFGIVAVDPQMIGLGTEVYVPGYGTGYAGDTGGAIQGRRIDLGYDDDNLVLWYRWADVYLLTPIPDAINYRIGS